MELLEIVLHLAIMLQPAGSPSVIACLAGAYLKVIEACFFGAGPGFSATLQGGPGTGRR